MFLIWISFLARDMNLSFNSLGIKENKVHLSGIKVFAYAQVLYSQLLNLNYTTTLHLLKELLFSEDNFCSQFFSSNELVQPVEMDTNHVYIILQKRHHNSIQLVKRTCGGAIHIDETRRRIHKEQKLFVHYTE